MPEIKDEQGLDKPPWWDCLQDTKEGLRKAIMDMCVPRPIEGGIVEEMNILTKTKEGEDHEPVA